MVRRISIRVRSTLLSSLLSLFVLVPAAGAVTGSDPISGGGLGISIVDVRSTGDSTKLLVAGDRLTIDLRLENPDRIGLKALGIVAFGHDPDRDGQADNGLRFVEGVQSERFFEVGRADGVGFGGFGSRTGPIEFVRRQGTSDPEHRASLGLVVSAIAGVSLTGIDGDGTLDVGVDGGLVSDGDVHLRLVYEAVSVAARTSLTLTFGIGDPTLSGKRPTYGEIALGANNLLLPFRNAEWRLEIAPGGVSQPVPEPGTALLVGLGLAGLAGRRARTGRISRVA